MARGGPPPGTVVLPKVEFEKVNDDVSTGGPPGVGDGQARSFGYNDGYPFTRGELYIRHIEPLEIDLARQVEYDMDEQDAEWLEAVNQERRKEQLDHITAETFEIIMDRLEKEWFDLTKNLPKSDLAMPSEDSTCAVCDDSEGENSNAIVFCDGCNLAVHQDCYGVPYIPEGQWLCRKCTVSPENPVQCYLCPNEGGAFKQTIHGDWVHLLCAIWVPETRVANEVFMEPITGIEKISKQRWKLRCSICDVREGACIQCAKASCFVAFHATCARQEKLLMPMKTTQGSEPVTLQAYCERHLPIEQQNTRAAALAAEAEQDDDTAKLSSKSARAYNKTYKPGPPIVPSIIVNRISQYIHRIKIRKKVEFVQMVCRYWSLKREARRGAPLLKRLHLEPWTAGGGKIQTIEEKRMKLDQLQRLRKDLAYVKTLALLVKWRELRKLKQTEIIHQVLSSALYPHEAALRLALEKIMQQDKMDFFKNPVNKNEVPDYFDIVLNPMCWSMIEDRLDKHEYWDVKSFRDDIDLVINNALLYNQPGTAFWKAALKVRTVSQPLLKDLEKLALPQDSLPHRPAATAEGEASEPSVPLVGDLESPLEVLELLVHNSAISDQLGLELQSDPLTSLYSSEEARYKPPPPLSPLIPPNKSKKSGRKRDRRAERSRSKKARNRTTSGASASVEPGVAFADQLHEEGAAVIQRMKVEADAEGRLLDLREPRTRASIAAAVAFEKEALLPEEDQSAPTPLTAPPDSSASTGGPGPATKQQKKRPSMSLPPSTTPRVVEDVDNQDSFQFFNSGWILPPDTKRHGRAPVEKQILPPPRKKQKIDHIGARQSTVSTAPSEPHLASPLPDGGEASTSAGPSSSHKMEIDPFSVPPGQAFPPGASFDETVIQRTTTDASGRVVIEELDTPLTRRQKSMKKKAEKRRSAGMGDLPTFNLAEVSGHGAGVNAGDMAISSPGRPPSSAGAPSTPAPPSAGPSSMFRIPALPKQRSDNNEGAESESELSELSELPSEIASSQRSGAVREEEEPVPKKTPSQAKRVRGKRRLMELYDSGTLVWAKAESYPWWPAVVFDPDHLDVPHDILVQFKETRSRRKMKLYIVRFYDRGSTWAYLGREKLKMLGEDDTELDTDMISNTSINQRWKNPKIRTDCRAAYRKAIGEMERADGDADADGEPDEEGDAADT
ncbi:hypothetical protein MD484_g3339, partial [Candolleomyces efflorescens]